MPYSSLYVNRISRRQRASVSGREKNWSKKLNFATMHSEYLVYAVLLVIPTKCSEGQILKRNKLHKFFHLT
jgi:hypothetical protein